MSYESTRWKMCKCGVKMSIVKSTDDFILYECVIDRSLGVDIIVGSSLDIKLNLAGKEVRELFIKALLVCTEVLRK